LLTLEQLKQAVHAKGVTKTDVALLCVAAGGGREVATPAVKRLAIDAGVKGARAINFGAHLHSAEDKVFKTPAGWELTETGRLHVASSAALTLAVSPAATEAKSLRATLPAIESDDARAFLTEAVVCAEQSLHRAAVVLSWVGAVALLQEKVLQSHLASFNAEAARRDSRWKAAKSRDDLNRMKESEFLEVLQAISMLGKNVKQELDACLKLRNGCGHPSSLKVGSNKVAAHLETLSQNVFSAFS
jgi:hypothetical protein